MKIVVGGRKIVFKKRLFFWLLLFLGIVLIIIFRPLPKNFSLRTFEKGKIQPVQTLDKKEQAVKDLKAQYQNKLVIIFFYDGYKNQNDALNDINVLKETLKIVEPFKSMQDLLAFKVFTTDSQKCDVKASGKIKVLVCDKNLINSFKILGVDRFKLVILSPLQFVTTSPFARGTNSWMSISTSREGLSEQDYKRFLGIAFAQNLGHAMGLSLEDNVSSSSAEQLPELPNCAQSEALGKQAWGSYSAVYNNIGYFKGCQGNVSYVYPQKDTLMSAHPKLEGYGKVSEDYLAGVISCFYGNKGKPDFSNNKDATLSAAFSSCPSFTSTYPRFWQE
ncbi:MAG: hypothetical protein ACM3IJ_00380 [Candidatus Levyibacteriota bacterium]